MDRGYYMVFCFLGFTAAMAVFFLLGAKRRAWIPPLAWWLFLIVGCVICMYGLSHSTVPSFAPRITAVGKAYDHFERRRGRETSYGFRFVPEGGGSIMVETEIILPKWGIPAIFNGQTFRVVYLDDNDMTSRMSASIISILSGCRCWRFQRLQARTVGKWLQPAWGGTGNLWLCWPSIHERRWHCCSIGRR